MNKLTKLSTALLAAGILAATLTGCTQAPVESAPITIGEYQGSVGSLEGMNLETTEYKEALATKLDLSRSVIEASDVQVLCLTEDTEAINDNYYSADVIFTDEAHAGTDYAAATNADLCETLAPTDLVTLDFHAIANGIYLIAMPSEDGLTVKTQDVTSDDSLEGAYFLSSITASTILV